MNSWQCAAAGLIAWLSLVPAVSAQGALENRIRQLESRVQKLEQANQTQSASPTRSQTSQHQLRENWRALRVGMSESDVRGLLGEAHKIDTNPYFVNWYWDYPGGGKTQFDAKSRLLKEWSEP